MQKTQNQNYQTIKQQKSEISQMQNDLSALEQKKKEIQKRREDERQKVNSIIGTRESIESLPSVRNTEEAYAKNKTINYFGKR